MSTHVSIHHFRQSRISSTGERLRDASLETVRYLPLTVRRLRFHREHQVRLAFARVFTGVLFKQVPSATFFKRFVSAHATDRAIHAHARCVESTYYFLLPFRNLENEINAKLFQLFNLFDRSDLDTDRPISASLLYFGLFVNEIKRVCTCITGISWQLERMRV